MKHFTLLSMLASLLLAFAVFAQPPGDVCETAFPLTVPGTHEGTVCGYGDDYDEMCPYGGSETDVVYGYLPAVNQVVNFSLCEGITDYDTKMFVYAGSCPGQLIACNDDGCTAPNYPYPYVSRLGAVPLISGIQYYVIIDGYGSGCGNYTLVTTVLPPGDVCANALSLSVPDTVSGNTIGYSNDYSYLCDGGTETGSDVVYTYTQATNDTVTFNLCTGGTDFNTRLYIYAGPCYLQQIIACDRYGCELYPEGWRSMLLCVPVTAGTTYFIVIDGGTATEEGNYSLVTSTCPPPGDICETALPISIPDTVAGNNCIYTHQYDWVCPYTWVVYSRDVVYSYIPAADQRATFDLCNGTTNYDTKMFIYANTCESNPIACNDDFCEAPHFGYSWVSRLEAIPLWADTTYYIVVDAYWTYYCGDYTLVTSVVPPDPPQHLVILREPDNSSHLRLTWNLSFGASIYYVYRDAVSPMQTLLATTPDTTYVDSNAVNDPATHYFYAVTAGIE